MAARRNHHSFGKRIEESFFRTDGSFICWSPRERVPVPRMTSPDKFRGGWLWSRAALLDGRVHGHALPAQLGGLPRDRRGYPPGGSRAGGSLGHAGVHGEAVNLPDDRENSPYLSLRRGEQQVAPGVPRVHAAKRQCGNAARVDELQPGQVNYDPRLVGRDGPQGEPPRPRRAMRSSSPRSATTTWPSDLPEPRSMLNTTAPHCIAARRGPDPAAILASFFPKEYAQYLRLRPVSAI